MCGRYHMEEEITLEELQRIIDAVNRNMQADPALSGLAIKQEGEVFPSDRVPAVCAAGPRAMGWGFGRPDGKGLVINARAEGLLERPMFRGPALGSRCLIPAAYYFEWQTQGREKVKYRLGGADGGLLYMAGLYRQEPGAKLPVFAIVTRAAGPDIAFIHNRMPVILPQGAREAWLAPGEEGLAALTEAVECLAFRPQGPAQTSLFS